MDILNPPGLDSLASLFADSYSLEFYSSMLVQSLKI
jgi:hypothetical protein